MIGYPMVGPNTLKAHGPDTSDSLAVTVTGTTANTKGSYAQIVASTTYPADGFWICVANESGSNQKRLVDFAIGAAASEQVIVSNLNLTGRHRIVRLG